MKTGEDAPYHFLSGIVCSTQNTIHEVCCILLLLLLHPLDHTAMWLILLLTLIIDPHKQNLACIPRKRLRILPVFDLPDGGFRILIIFQFYY